MRAIAMAILALAAAQVEVKQGKDFLVTLLFSIAAIGFALAGL